MSNKIAIFSDLHLGVHQNSNFWIDISFKWVEWFKNELELKNIKTVYFCGDFFHYRDEVSLVTLDAAQKILEILKDFDITMITGNHDCYYKETSEVNSLSLFKGWKNVKVYDTVTTIFDKESDKTITFCPWGTKIDNIPLSDYIFGHFELQNFKMNIHKICDTGDSPEDLANKSPNIFSGHFHLKDDKQIKNSIIHYVGNPFEMDFSDSYQKKGYHILDFQTGEYTFVENTFTPKHITIYLSKLIKLRDVEEHFNLLLPNNIIKLIVDKNISSDHLDILVSKMVSYKPNDLHVDYDVNYNKIKLEDNVKLNLSGVDIPKAIEDFVNLLDINNKKEVIDYTIDLYNRSKL